MGPTYSLFDRYKYNEELFRRLLAMHRVFEHQELVDPKMAHPLCQTIFPSARSYFHGQICVQIPSEIEVFFHKRGKFDLNVTKTHKIFSFNIGERAATIAMWAGILTSSIPTINCTSQNCRSVRNLPKSSCKVHRG